MVVQSEKALPAHMHPEARYGSRSSQSSLPSLRVTELVPDLFGENEALTC